jgi:hypothetical protein
MQLRNVGNTIINQNNIVDARAYKESGKYYLELARVKAPYFRRYRYRDQDTLQSDLIAVKSRS